MISSQVAYFKTNQYLNITVNFWSHLKADVYVVY